MRELSTSFRNSVEAQHNTELMLVFAKVEHADLDAPFYVVTEDVEGVSYANGLPINYKYAGNTYLGCPFGFSLLSDDDRPPRSRLTIQNVDRRIGDAVKACRSSPRFSFFILKLSDFTDELDSSNSRIPLGTPTVEYSADYLFLKNVTGDAGVISADITAFDVSREPCPAVRTTQDRTPGLYR